MLIDQELVKAVSRIQIRAIYKLHTHTHTYIGVHDALSVGRLVFMLMFEHDCGPLTVDLQMPKPAAVCATCVELVGTTRGRQRYYTTKRIQYIPYYHLVSSQ